uniref:Major facilitator superfamily (MFS) profile domain-containing protein n=1 Tax=Panagrolaimus superbus TaxID=310955 RepID=A0A914Y9Z0_9BILA
MLFIGISYPNLNVSLNTIFSKIIGPRPQTVEQGWLQVAGSSGRMIGPITMSALYVSYGPRWSWNVEITLILITLFCWLIMKNKMVPLTIPKEYSEFHDINDPDMIKKLEPLEKDI